MGLTREREFFIDNLLVWVHRCFWCTGLAPWEFESPFPGSLISTFLGGLTNISHSSQSLSHSRAPNPELSTLISGGARGSVLRADQHIHLTPPPLLSLPSNSVTLAHTTLPPFTLSHTLSLTHSLTLTLSGGARGWVLRADEHLRALVRRLDVVRDPGDGCGARGDGLRPPPTTPTRSARLDVRLRLRRLYRGTSPIRNRAPPQDHLRPLGTGLL